MAPTQRLMPPRDLHPALPAPSGRERALVFVLLAGLVVGLLAGAFGFRDNIMDAFPGSRSIYDLVGLAAPRASESLELANLENDEHNADGRRLIDISGVVFNPSDQTFDLPSIVIAFTDGAGKLIDEANVFQFEQKRIDAGENIAFRARDIEMPEGAKSFRVGFGHPN
jgi:hypothetical protein